MARLEGLGVLYVEQILAAAASPRLALLLLEARPDAARALTPALLRRLEPRAHDRRAEAVAYLGLCGLVLRRWLPASPPAGAWWLRNLEHLNVLWANVAEPGRLGRLNAETDVFSPLARPSLVAALAGGPADGEAAFDFLVAFWERHQEDVRRRHLACTQNGLRRRRASLTIAGAKSSWSLSALPRP